MKSGEAHVWDVMSKTLEVPDELYEALEKRAATEQFSVDEYARQALLRGLEAPVRPLDKVALDELFAKLNALPPMDFGGLTAAEVIRQGREEHDEHIWDALHPRR